MNAVLGYTCGERIKNKAVMLLQIHNALKERIQASENRYFCINSIDWREHDDEYIASIKVTENKKHPSDQYELFVKMDGDEFTFYNSNHVPVFYDYVVA